jgi:short-subunit dehydrogenase
MKKSSTIALITGASGGIGEALAEEHAKRGGAVALVARNAQALQNLASRLEISYNIKAYYLPIDLCATDACSQLFAWTDGLELEVDTLINNAGFGDLGPFLDASLETHTRMMTLNMEVLVKLSHHFGQKMAAKGRGRILQVASIAAFMPGPGMSVYYATKSFVLSFSEGIAEEWRDKGVTVSTLCPGPTATGFQQTANMDMQKVMMGMFAKMPTAASVANFGYSGMLKGRRVMIHGFSNRLMLFFARLLPTSWKATMMRKIQFV